MFTLDLPLLNRLEAIAKDAGHEILKIYDTDFNVQTKSDDSPLTAADLAAHNVIIDALATLTPDIPVLSEESASIPFDTRSSWSQYWLVDPLDGTKEFVKRNGEFTVNIAFIDNHTPTLGVVYCPVKEIMYSAAEGLGAFKTMPGEERKSIHCTPSIKAPIRVVGSRSHGGDALVNIFNNIGTFELITMGSSLKICLVAEGAADIYPRLGLTSEWDTAAAHAIVLAAGGQLTLTAQTPLTYNTKDSLLNPYFLAYGDDSISWAEHFQNHNHNQ